MDKQSVKKLYVTQDNKLLEGAYSATLDEMRLLYLALVQKIGRASCREIV